MKTRPIVILGVVFCLVSGAAVYGTTDGTTGTPLGGLGTGAVKFCAGSGTFAFNDQTPTRYGDYTTLAGAQFQLFSKQYGVILTQTRLQAARDSSGRIMDDAAFPTYQATFSPVNNVEISMKGFAPFDPAHSDNMAMPYAFFEFTFQNTGSSQAEVSIALQLTTEQIPLIGRTGGLADLRGVHQKCVLVRDPDGTAVVSVGGGNAFFQSGICENSVSGNTNRIAAYFKLQPQGSKSILFVFAWFNHSDLTRYYYTNLFSNASEVAMAGSTYADDFKNNAYSLVNRMRSSNLPTWLIDQTLNSAANLVNNSIYTVDGRYCHNEGMYTMDGTMDQMWHGRLINIQLVPDIAWKELEYWARCQRQAAGVEGQIHHDFGSNGTYAIAAWDETDYADYRNIDHWVDLNCGFIISVYEAFIATADYEKLSLLWPYVKKAGQRILDQVQTDGDPAYPYTFSTSQSSYDAGGNSQAFNSGLSIATYNILLYLSQELGDSTLVSQFSTAFDTAVTSYSRRWLEQPVTVGGYCESVLGGPWIANFLKLGQFWPSSGLYNLFSTIDSFYDPLSNGLGYTGGSYSEWQTYLVAHLGGFALQTGHSDIWHALQFDMYERNYLDRNRVFNQALGVPSKVSTPNYAASSTSGSNQYISIPVVWRNYYDLVGYHRNQATGELWLEPRLLPELNHEMTNATVISPEGLAAITATESGEQWQNQQITFVPDQTIYVDAIYVTDKYGDQIQSVLVNDVPQSFSRVGVGYQRRLRIDWSGDVDPAGLAIAVTGDPKPSNIPNAPDQLKAIAKSATQIDLAWHDNSTNEMGFYVECKAGDAFAVIAMVDANVTTFSHTALLQDKEYTYRVRAYNQDGASAYSNDASATTLKAGNGEVVFAVNAGGPAYTGKDGTHYVTDISASFCSGGTTYSTSDAITGTRDGTLYQTERYGNFSYSIPLSNGSYEVTFKFAEIYWTAAGSRLFNVTMEGAPVLSNFDIFKLAGKDVAYDITMPVTITDGTLSISFITLTDNAKLSALVVRKASSP